MNETLKSIKNRRSVRDYQAKQINQLLDRISKAAQEEYKKSNDKFIQQFANNENFHIFHKAPAAVIISGAENAMAAQIDCALAAGNMMIAAESIGIGSCWVSAAPNIINAKNDMDLNNQLGIPNGFKPIYSIALGYKATEADNEMPRKVDVVNYVR